MRKPKATWLNHRGTYALPAKAPKEFEVGPAFGDYRFATCRCPDNDKYFQAIELSSGFLVGNIAPTRDLARERAVRLIERVGVNGVADRVENAIKQRGLVALLPVSAVKK